MDFNVMYTINICGFVLIFKLVLSNLKIYTFG